MDRHRGSVGLTDVVCSTRRKDVDGPARFVDVGGIERGRAGCAADLALDESNDGRTNVEASGTPVPPPIDASNA